MSLSVGQLRALVRPAVAKAKAKRRPFNRFGFYAPSGWNGPAEISIDGTMWHVAEARSPLAAREHLSGMAAENCLLIVCGVSEENLGSDMLARFGLPTLLRANPLETLKDLFQVASVDPRILPRLKYVDLLVDHAPEEGFSPAPSGLLNAETFWTQLLHRVWGIPLVSPDIVALLRWSREPDAGERYRASSVDFRAAASEWIGDAAGSAAVCLLRSLSDATNPPAIALGLACGVLFHPNAGTDTSLVQARVRMERFLDNHSIGPADAAAWANASDVVASAMATESPSSLGLLSRQLDDVLQALQVGAHAVFSVWSQLGFDSLIERIGTLVQNATRTQSRASLEEARGLRDALRKSRLAGQHAPRLNRLDMCLRLCAWLTSSPAGDIDIRSLPDAASRYLREESHVDWARSSLIGGDPSPVLSEAMTLILRSVGPRREKFNEAFARLLRGWTNGDPLSAKITPIQEVLSRAVAPAGETKPVLLIVLDGMSAAVFDELVTDLAAHDWRTVVPEGGSPPLVLSAIPSVTELARTSLLSGRLQIGGQAEELLGFSQHAELHRKSRTGAPKLFHKGVLTSAGDAALAPEVADAISSNTRFVAVVINAIDDHLMKGEQLALTWTSTSIRILPSLLARASDVGRFVLLVSDHGHLLDQGTTQTTGSDSDRYRKASPSAADGEIELEPQRLGLGVSTSPMVFAYSESIRYCGRKNGYHGGVSPQELVVPFACMWHGSSPPEGWTDAPLIPPSWWIIDDIGIQGMVPKPASHKPVASPASLFDPVPTEIPTPPTTEIPDWIDRLFKTDLFKGQRQRAGRNVPTPEDVAKFIQAMLSRGGKLTRPALARALGMPELRVNGYVSQVRRILNVDGYPIVHIEEESSTIELNDALLKTQFDLNRADVHD